MQNSQLQAANAATDSRALGDRLLALIDSIHDPQGLSREHVERTTGLALQAEPDSVYLYGTRGALEGGWSYRLGATAGEDDTAGSLLLTFNHADGDGADMAPVCSPDFDTYRAALQRQGFDARPVPGDHGSTRYWEFARNGVTVRIRTMGESRARADHACVSTLSIHA